MDSTKNTKAIVVYVDNKNKCIEEFSWLWKSWLMWGINEEWDLIAFTNPDALVVVESKFKHDNLHVISKKSLGKKDTEWEGYGFVNSFAMFDDPYGDVINKHYEYVLKTDCDTFLTKNFKELELDPHRTHVGVGMYYPIDSGIDSINTVRSNIIATSKALGLDYKNISHVGASMLGTTETVSSICKLQKTVTSTLLKYGWPPENNGDWPGWWKGTASMYGGEIAINHLLGPMNIIKGNVDVFCTDNHISSSDLHIHAWQVDENTMVFNKKKYHNGELQKNDGRELFKNKSFKSGDYCLMVATHKAHELKSLVKDFSN